jgi:uncharacterized membrane protein
VLLAFAIAAYAVGFGSLSVLRYLAFATGRFDLGNMTQAVWATAHGHPLEVTSAHGKQFVRLGAHVDPILVAFAPLWRVWPSPAMLLVAQAVAVALGALPLFWLGERRLGSDVAALGFALAYLLSPPVEWMTLADFHPVALATPLLLASFWALDRDRLVVFAVFGTLAAATKEHVGLVLAAIGIWYAISRRRPVAGAVVAGIGVAWTVAALTLVLPHFSPTGEPTFYGRYETVGGSFGGIARTALTDPARIVASASDRRGLEYLGELLGPLAALPALAPLAALAALPELALNLLSSVSTQTSIRYHYSAAALAVLFAASVLGTARLAGGRPRRAEVAAGVVTALSLAAGYALGPLPVWRGFPGGDGLAWSAVDISEHDRVAQRAVSVIPPSTVVSTSDSLGAHLSARRRILSFPQVADARWVAVDMVQPGYLGRAERRRAPVVVAELRRSPRWRVVLARDGVLVLRRPVPGSPRPERVRRGFGTNSCGFPR